MKKYVLTGITDYAKNHLTVEDAVDIFDMIGCEIELNSDGLFTLPDGTNVHTDFICYEEEKTNASRNIVKEHAELYQPLFDLMQDEHNLILIISEMDDILEACEKVKQNFTEWAEQSKERSKE